MAQEKVYVWPFTISSEDKLTDGSEEKSIDIDSQTLLMWIDLHPKHRFAHDTLYALISSDTSRIVQGQWWPQLNGKRILYGEKNLYGILSPWVLPTNREGKDANVHIYPFVITKDDKLTDGPGGQSMEIEGDTMLIWVDLDPQAKFAHNTLFTLICGKKSRIIQSQWWPELNGKRIRFPTSSTYAVTSPVFKARPE